MSVIHIVEPSPVGGVGAMGALILGEALREAGHTVVRATLSDGPVQQSLLPETDRIADVRGLPRPEAWFISCLSARQFVHLPALFRGLGVAPLAAERAATDPLVAFGGQASIAPAAVMRFVDLLALGDGEVTGVSIAAALASGKPAALRSLAGQPGFFVPALQPGRLELTRVEAPSVAARVIRPGERGHPTIELARGCRSKCAFCSIGWAGGTYREAPREQVAATLEKLGSRSVSLFAPDYSSVSWVDDLESLVERVGCSPKQRDARMDATVRQLKTGTGARSYAFGVEGVSERLRRAIGKPLSREQVVETMRLLQAGGVALVRWYCILALPGEGPEDYLEFDELLDAVADVYFGRLDVTLTHFQSVPHTPLESVDNHYNVDAERAAEAITARLKRWWLDGKRQWLASNFKSRETHEHDVFLQRLPEAGAAEYLLKLNGRTSQVQNGRWRVLARGCGLDVEAVLGPQADLPWAGVDCGVDRDKLKRFAGGYWPRLVGRQEGP